MFDKIANKTLKEIIDMKDVDIQLEALRCLYSRMIFDHTEENPLKFNPPYGITVEFRDYFGLSMNNMPGVTEMFQEDGEGIIWIKFYGDNEPREFDDYSVNDLIDIALALEW